MLKQIMEELNWIIGNPVGIGELQRVKLTSSAMKMKNGNMKNSEFLPVLGLLETPKNAEYRRYDYGDIRRASVYRCNLQQSKIWFGYVWAMWTTFKTTKKVFSKAQGKSLEIITVWNVGRGHRSRIQWTKWRLVKEGSQCQVDQFASHPG